MGREYTAKDRKATAITGWVALVSIVFGSVLGSIIGSFVQMLAWILGPVWLYNIIRDKEKNTGVGILIFVGGFILMGSLNAAFGL